ncbi:type I-E CRISPR-associated protein Cse2/CasB [Nocardioides sp. GY 10113]|uniref:type I-E CRISPR-associated protein Cse2/CasB n=1 Tax=Nocardioides sp. GY 10113 TaxID=2569761 RepID=UPI0010A7E0FF|nr:type I-E CRISPR-associated protein Cse2/CasB [Nocardioides sp. GY 10113]TIC82197.1 type I-E CRISPR-associated protein Cse2/CasB [Nocardioides sp. GY 10113]
MTQTPGSSRKRDTPEAVATVLRLRTDTGSRARLRRAGSPATERFAYPLLAGTWTDATRQPILSFAALAGTFARVEHDETVPLGAMIRKTCSTPEDVTRMERRLTVAQNQTLSGFLTTLRYVFGKATDAGCAVNYVDLYWTVLNWEHPDLDRRNRVRRRLFETFFRADNAAAAAAAAAADPTLMP